MMNENLESQYERSDKTSAFGLRLKRISWPAMFAGVVTTLVVLFLLSLLGLAVGLGVVNPVTDPTPLSGLGTGAIIWWAVSNIIALFAGGWVTGRLSAIIAGPERVTNGIVMWGLYTILSLFIVTTSAGAVLGGAGSLLGLAGKEVASADSQDGNMIASVREEVNQLLRETGKPELQPEKLKSKVKSGAQSPQEMKETGKEVLSELDRDALVNIVMNRPGRSRAEAEAMVNQWVGEGKEGIANAEEDARRISERAAEATSQAALYSFFAMLLGAIAAGWGALIGRTDPEDDLWLKGRRAPVSAGPQATVYTNEPATREKVTTTGEPTRDRVTSTEKY